MALEFKIVRLFRDSNDGTCKELTLSFVSQEIVNFAHGTVVCNDREVDELPHRLHSNGCATLLDQLEPESERLKGGDLRAKAFGWEAVPTHRCRG